MGSKAQFVQVDLNQLIGEVKERNKLYKTITDIKEYALKHNLQEISKMCDSVLEKET